MRAAKKQRSTETAKLSISSMFRISLWVYIFLTFLFSARLLKMVGGITPPLPQTHILFPNYFRHSYFLLVHHFSLHLSHTPIHVQQLAPILFDPKTL